jgi:phosphate starvation-inducible PhoH-like protein
LEDRQLEFDDHKVAGFVYGQRDENLKIIEEILGVRISARGTLVMLHGEDPELALATRVLMQFYDLVGRGHEVRPADAAHAVNMLREDPELQLHDVLLDTIFTSHKNRSIAPKGLNQKRYVDEIRKKDIVFGVGPAGTGKTYLAMAMAVSALTRQECRRVILTRPAVEAGEKLGFLPGDLQDKVNPYLRPLYDALNDMLEFDRVERLIEKNAIEVAPLAFMRGRTLQDAFVVLDEAQNTTRAQMKMFLTRLGFESKAVITGDVTQIDLPSRRDSGLMHAVNILGGVKGIGVCQFEQHDVVRHPLVKRIIDAYERDDAQRDGRGSGAKKSKA